LRANAPEKKAAPGTNSLPVRTENQSEWHQNMSLRMGGVTGNNFSGGSCGGNKFLGCIRQLPCLLNFVCLGCVLLNASRLLL
jgi:hypothetical protein